jgi:hypothetical protein
MANQEVPKVNTPVSEAEMANALSQAARELFNIELTQPQLALLVAQNNLETASRKSTHNFNVGNITHSNDSFDYFIGGDKTKDKNGKWIPTKFKFRSYPTLKDGVKDYISNIKNRGHGIVWNNILTGDPAAFSKALKKTRYYEADEKDYTEGLKAHVSNFNKNYKAPPSNVAETTIDKITNFVNKFLKAIASMDVK